MFKKKINEIWKEINNAAQGKDVDQWVSELAMGKHKFDYADWYIEDLSKKFNVDVAALLRLACCLENITYLSADAKKFLLWRTGECIPVYHISQKLNGDFNVVIEGLYFTV